MDEETRQATQKVIAWLTRAIGEADIQQSTLGRQWQQEREEEEKRGTAYGRDGSAWEATYERARKAQDRWGHLIDTRRMLSSELA
jgi:hypothetical protein